MPLGPNSNNILMNINDDGNIKFSEIPKNLKNQHKKDLTPVQKNRNISGNKISAFYTEGNVKNINYSEQFIKFSNHKTQQDFSGQRQNTSNNISVSNSIYSNTNTNNNSVRMLSNQRNISNEKLYKGNNTMRNNEIPHSKDGKKYVMAKNVQRTKPKQVFKYCQCNLVFCEGCYKVHTDNEKHKYSIDSNLYDLRCKKEPSHLYFLSDIFFD